jgi:hypothetical protein
MEAYMGKHEVFTGAQRVAKRREALRALGMRPKQFWLPDLRDPKVLAEIRREVDSINRSEDEASMMAWIEANNCELLDSLPPYDWGEAGPTA